MRQGGLYLTLTLQREKTYNEKLYHIYRVSLCKKRILYNSRELLRENNPAPPAGTGSVKD
ncbi:hypothetical protein MCACP_16150 [Neomoorella carbonis]